MNRWLPYAGIPFSIALSYALVFTVPFAMGAIVAGIPLLFLGRKWSAVSGFLIGLMVPFSVYLLYPLGSVSRLSGIIAQLIGMPALLIIVVFPLMYGIMTAISALIFTGVRELAYSRKKEPEDASGEDAQSEA